MTCRRRAACPSCGQPEPIFIGDLPAVSWFSGRRLAKPVGGGSLYACRNCHLKFRYPVLRQDEYARLYDNDDTGAWPADGNRPDWDLVTRWVSERKARGGRLLDFGCYAGGLLARFGAGYERHGVEINRAASELASRHGRIWPSIEAMPSTLQFDVIVAADVLEHVADPGSLIRSLGDRLAPGGLLMLTTGDGAASMWTRNGANWWYCFFPEHIAFISRGWLDWFLASTPDLELAHCEAFRYLDHGRVRRSLDRVAVWLYGRLGRRFVRLLALLKAIAGNGGLRTVPGAGAYPDHLFVVLSKNPAGAGHA